MTYTRLHILEVPILMLGISMGYLLNEFVSVWSPGLTSSSGAGSGTPASMRRVIEQHQSTAQHRKILFECYELAKARTNINPKVQLQSETKLNTFSAEIQACLKARRYFSTVPSARPGADEQ